MRKPSVKERITRSIRRRDGVVILRSDVARFGSSSQVGRALAKLVAASMLIPVGHGLYAKTRVNSFTGHMTPAAPFESIAAEAFRRLGIVVGPGKLAREYNSARSTQIPMQPVVSTGKRRISRRIEVGSKRVAYEKRTPRLRNRVDC